MHGPTACVGMQALPNNGHSVGRMMPRSTSPQRQAVFFGTAGVDDQPPSPAEVEAYFTKYAAGIQMIGLTRESMAAEYSTVLRVHPTRVRTMD